MADRVRYPVGWECIVTDDDHGGGKQSEHLCRRHWDRLRTTGTTVRSTGKLVPRENVVDLAENTTDGMTRIGQRLGLKPLSVERALYRAGRPDLVARVRAREVRRKVSLP